MLIVVIRDISMDQIDPAVYRVLSTRFYPTPSRDGPARIEDAQVQGGEMYLTVSTAGGSRFVFHVNDGSYRSLAS